MSECITFVCHPLTTDLVRPITSVEPLLENEYFFNSCIRLLQTLPLPTSVAASLNSNLPSLLTADDSDSHIVIVSALLKSLFGEKPEGESQIHRLRVSVCV